MPFIAGGVVLAAIVIVAAIVLMSGSSSSTKLASANPHCDAHFAGWIKDGFPEPPTIESHDGELNTTLTATTYTIHVNHHTYEGLHYNGITPGPTLAICRGDTVHVSLVNKLPIPTNLHVHGLHVSPEGESDNVFISLNPLQAHHYTYQIPLDQSPGTFWYHPHFHPLVDAETTGGMLGAIIVEGGLDQRLANIPQRLIVIHGGKPVPPGGKPLPIPGVKPGQIKPHPPPAPESCWSTAPTSRHCTSAPGSCSAGASSTPPASATCTWRFRARPSSCSRSMATRCTKCARKSRS